MSQCNWIHASVLCHVSPNPLTQTESFASAKRNITDEKAALNEALDKYESEGLQNGKLAYSSGRACPDLGDVAMFGVLYSVRGLNAHDNAIGQRGGPIKEWYENMSKQVLG